MSTNKVSFVLNIDNGDYEIFIPLTKDISYDVAERIKLLIETYIPFLKDIKSKFYLHSVILEINNAIITTSISPNSDDTITLLRFLKSNIDYLIFKLQDRLEYKPFYYIK